MAKKRYTAEQIMGTGRSAGTEQSVALLDMVSSPRSGRHRNPRETSLMGSGDARQRIRLRPS